MWLGFEPTTARRCNWPGAIPTIRPSSGVINPASDLVNPHANKCLDVRDWPSNDGAPLQIWECTDGPNQKWHLSYLGGGQFP